MSRDIWNELFLFCGKVKICKPISKSSWFGRSNAGKGCISPGQGRPTTEKPQRGDASASALWGSVGREQDAGQGHFQIFWAWGSFSSQISRSSSSSSVWSSWGSS